MPNHLPIGIYEQVVNEIIYTAITDLQSSHGAHKAPIDPALSEDILSSYLARIIREVLLAIDRKDHVIEDRVVFCNELIRYMTSLMANSHNPDPELIKRLDQYWIRKEGEMLLSIAEMGVQSTKTTKSLEKEKPVIRPNTSIAMQSLFTGAVHEPKMEAELRREIASCDRIDWLVSFVKWTGLRLVMEELKNFTEAGGKLRIITTSYIGATDYKAVKWLSELPNTEIKISYDTERTRLHAKTYVFWRNSGFSTAYIGSSNLSDSAMTSGLEWNVKLSEYDSKAMLSKISATFESYWNSSEFMSFNPLTDEDRLKSALLRARGIDPGQQSALNIHYFDVKPHHYQQEILDQLEAEREVHGHFKNLVVAATGTGKTVISAFDYKRFKDSNPRARLLFVAHRKEILNQSMLCYRNILRQQNFGGLLVDGQRPDSFEYAFVSIQSLNSTGLLEALPADYYDYIVVDEFHHAAAPSYQELLKHFKPKILLGLTATPERADGESVFKYFDNPEAIQLRLTEAIDRKLLSPFHYFGVTDQVDFRQVRWTAGKYNVEDLENLLVLNDQGAKRRAEQVKSAIEIYGLEWSETMGIGFCVSKRHANFMAEYFNASGIPSESLTSDSSDDLRETVKQKLIQKEIHFIFVVDLYNEGVDIPEVNTVLFLRPTESLTVFLQQLGRGLRLSPGKEALTVIDFVAQQKAEYNFEARFRALMKKTRKSVSQEIKDGFVHVPRGCGIYLEKVAQQTVLQHIESAVNNKKKILEKIADWKHRSSSEDYLDFFKHWHVSPLEVYKVDSKKATLTGLSRHIEADSDLDNILVKGFARLSQVKAVHWLKWLLETLPALKANDFNTEATALSPMSQRDTKWLDMLYYSFFSDQSKSGFPTLETALKSILSKDAYFNELMSVLKFTYERQEINTKLLPELSDTLELHGVYSVNMILSAVGKHTYEKRYPLREGVLYVGDQDLDLFLITLNKNEADYSETTLYDDYALTETLMHWQSQSRTTVQSPTGQRYVTQKGSNRKVMLFARAYRQEDGFTSLYTCLGLADYVSHNGSAPINIVWELRERMPAYLLDVALKAE